MIIRNNGTLNINSLRNTYDKQLEWSRLID